MIKTEGKEKLKEKGFINLQKNCPIEMVHNGKKDILFSRTMIFQYDDIKFATEWLKKYSEPALSNTYYHEWTKKHRGKIPFRKWIIEQAFHDLYLPRCTHCRHPILDVALYPVNDGKSLYCSDDCYQDDCIQKNCERKEMKLLKVNVGD